MRVLYNVLMICLTFDDKHRFTAPNSLFVLTEYIASFIFSTCYTILLYVWLEQWAAKKQFSSDPFRHLFFSFTATVYVLVIACLLCEASLDDTRVRSTITDYGATYRLRIP